MKLLLIAMPSDTRYADLTENQKRAMDRMNARWHKVGINWTAGNGTTYMLVNFRVNDLFKVEGELDGEGNPVIPTPLPSGWILGSAHKVNRSDGDLYEEVPDGDPIIVPANNITIEDVTYYTWRSKKYVKPVYDNTDPENPVFTGVNIYDGKGRFLRYLEGGSLDDRRGCMEPITQTMANINNKGYVDPSQLNEDGTYTHQPTKRVLVEPALTELMTPDARLINFLPDIDDQGTRPTNIYDIIAPKRFG